MFAVGFSRQIQLPDSITRYTETNSCWLLRDTATAMQQVKLLTPKPYKSVSKSRCSVMKFCSQKQRMHAALQPCLVVFWREVGDHRGRVLAIAAVDMAQHNCLVKGLSSSNFAVMAAKVLVLASYPDVALPLLRALVLAHTMVAGGLSLQPLLFAPARRGVAFVVMTLYIQSLFPTNSCTNRGNRNSCHR